MLSEHMPEGTKQDRLSFFDGEIAATGEQYYVMMITVTIDRTSCPVAMLDLDRPLSSCQIRTSLKAILISYPFVIVLN